MLEKRNDLQRFKLYANIIKQAHT